MGGMGRHGKAWEGMGGMGEHGRHVRAWEAVPWHWGDGKAWGGMGSRVRACEKQGGPRDCAGAVCLTVHYRGVLQTVPVPCAVQCITTMEKLPFVGDLPFPSTAKFIV